MSGETKPMRMPDFSKRKSSNDMIRELLKESFMLVRKFYCIGLILDFLQKNYSLNGKAICYCGSVPLRCDKDFFFER
jgi:hypothetical protein